MSIIDEFLSSGEPSQNVRIVCGFLLAIISIFGAVFNTLVFLSVLIRVKKKNGFLKICCFNSFGNGIVCYGYLVWPIPVTFSNTYFFPHMFGAFIGQFVAWFAWSIGPLSQVLLTTNRICAVFFPHAYVKHYKYSPSNIGILISFGIATILFVAFFPEGCHYLYNKDYIGWISEDTFCIKVTENTFLVSMTIISIYTTVCGILLFRKLLSTSLLRKVSNHQTSERNRKNRRLLIQALIQSSMILIDSLNSVVTWKLFPVLFFQFLTLSFSMVFLRAMEGFIMYYMNDEINQAAKAMLRIRSQVNNSQVFMVPQMSTSGQV